VTDENPPDAGGGPAERGSFVPLRIDRRRARGQVSATSQLNSPARPDAATVAVPSDRPPVLAPRAHRRGSPGRLRCRQPPSVSRQRHRCRHHVGRYDPARGLSCAIAEARLKVSRHRGCPGHTADKRRRGRPPPWSLRAGLGARLARRDRRTSRQLPPSRRALGRALASPKYARSLSAIRCALPLEFMAFRGIRTLEDAMRIVAAVGHPALGRGRSTRSISSAPAGRQMLWSLSIRGSSLACTCPTLRAPAPADLISEARQNRLYPGEGELPLIELMSVLSAGTSGLRSKSRLGTANDSRWLSGRVKGAQSSKRFACCRPMNSHTHRGGHGGRR